MTQLKVGVEFVARVCHEANRALQFANWEDDISLKWDEAPEWQRKSARNGVVSALFGYTPEGLHNRWMREKLDDGWVYGPEKDAAKKTHPCMVPYSELPDDQRAKDYVFQAVVQAFKDDKDVTVDTHS